MVIGRAPRVRIARPRQREQSGAPMFGMEIETRIPITVTKTDGKITLMESDKFKVVRDGHTGFGPVVEFVMHPIGRNASLDATLGELNARFALIKAAAETLATAAPGQPLQPLLSQSVPSTPDRRFAAACGTATIREVAPDIYDQDAPVVAKYVALDVRDEQARRAAVALRSRLHGPVHYTAGFALRAIPRLVEERLTAVDSPHRTRQRALEAVEIAKSLTGRPFAKVDMAIVAGYVALVYLQIAAVQDGYAGTLTKNHTVALCRVPLGTIFKDLSIDEQTWAIHMYGDFIEKASAKLGPEDGWQDGVHQLVEGAFSGKVIHPDEQDIFGGMTVIDASETVDPAGQQRGYALELRHSPSGYGDLAKVRQQAEDLLRYVWNLHDPAAKTGRPKSTDDFATPPPRK
jgi:hypothetical protein